jgi:hypothetical protein
VDDFSIDQARSEIPVVTFAANVAAAANLQKGLYLYQTYARRIYRVGAFGDGAGMALMAEVALPRTTPRSGSHAAVNM